MKRTRMARIGVLFLHGCFDEVIGEFACLFLDIDLPPMRCNVVSKQITKPLEFFLSSLSGFLKSWQITSGEESCSQNVTHSCSDKSLSRDKKSNHWSTSPHSLWEIPSSVKLPMNMNIHLSTLCLCKTPEIWNPRSYIFIFQVSFIELGMKSQCGGNGGSAGHGHNLLLIIIFIFIICSHQTTPKLN